MRDINDILKIAATKGASDLHVKVGAPPNLRISGHLFPVDNAERLGMEDMFAICKKIMSPAQIAQFRKTSDLDFAYSVPGLGRFRCNAFLQRGAIGVVFRLIPVKIPTLEELFLPDVITKLANEERGLILVTGVTGSGKSTTMASMINYINLNKMCNIVTIEDPIEYLHRDQRSLINQREVGADTSSFNIALRAALRQDPDVILVGEMRDIETISTAMSAAETGHLVMSTLHTTDTQETVNRIISAFPPHQHGQVRTQLAAVLKGIISMRLVPRADGRGRAPAVEVLVATSLIKDCIVDTTKTSMIRDYVSQGKLHYGMQTFDQSLLDLYKSGTISYDDACRFATKVEDFKLKVSGVGDSDDDKVDMSGGGGDDDGGMKIDRF